jgi:gluconate 2-dehydrogenase gamma chain
MRDTNTASEDRRGFLKQVAALAAATPLGLHIAERGDTGSSVTAPPNGAGMTQASLAAPFTGYQFFGPDEATFVEALVNVMCPADQYTPSGVDCGLANYIDRQLAGAFGQGEGRYTRGPWHEGKPELGYQLPLTPAEFFRVGLAAAQEVCVKSYGKSFDQLSAADANAFLEDLQAGRRTDPRVPLATWFNEFAYPLFVQACFADPIYGGNYDKVFWRLVGYPGLPANHALDMVTYRGKPYPGAQDPKSIADFA